MVELEKLESTIKFAHQIRNFLSKHIFLQVNTRPILIDNVLHFIDPNLLLR